MTAPGWCLFVLNLILAGLSIWPLKEPPHIERAPVAAASNDEVFGDAAAPKFSFWKEFKTVKFGAFFSIMYSCFILATNITCGDVFITENSQHEWGWSIEWSALYVGFIMTALIPFCLVSPYLVRALKMSDRNAIPIFYVVSAGFVLFLINWPGLDNSHPPYTRIGLFTTGAFFTNGIPSIVRGFTMSLASKIVPISCKQMAITCGQLAFMLGRTLGSSLGSVLKPNTFPYFQLGTILSLIGLHMIFYKGIVPHSKAE